MNVSLTPVLEDYIKGKVDSGLYRSSSEVIREGLRALQEKEVDSKIAIGLAQAQAGLGVSLDSNYAQDLKSRIAKRVESKQN